jgi:hypothetical protein
MTWRADSWLAFLRLKHLRQNLEFHQTFHCLPVPS